MHLALLQTRQNGLYRFDQPDRRYTAAQARALQEDMLEQTFSLMEAARGCDLTVTTEAVNYPGGQDNVEGNWLELLPGEHDPLWGRVRQAARKLGGYLVFGCYRLDRGIPRNSAMIYGPDGELVDVYDKIQLAGDEQRYLVPGRRFVTVDAPFGRFAPCICWDMQFPEICRTLALMDARLVVCPTWGWEGIYAHARAYENGIFTAGAMSVPAWMDIEGLRHPSEAVAPWGEVLARASRNRAETLVCELDLQQSDAYHTLRMGDRRPDVYGALV